MFEFRAAVSGGRRVRQNIEDNQNPETAALLQDWSFVNKKKEILEYDPISENTAFASLKMRHVTGISAIFLKFMTK